MEREEFVKQQKKQHQPQCSSKMARHSALPCLRALDIHTFSPPAFSFLWNGDYNNWSQKWTFKVQPTMTVVCPHSHTTRKSQEMVPSYYATIDLCFCVHSALFVSWSNGLALYKMALPKRASKIHH
jgi:hypothetical protein